jgi:hypothetical protein
MRPAIPPFVRRAGLDAAASRWTLALDTRAGHSLDNDVMDLAALSNR